MLGSLPTRLAVAMLATVVGAAGLTPPAQAAPQTGTITGRFTDHTGAPVGGIQAVASELTGSEAAGSDETDADGRYTITGLPLGLYRVDFDPDRSAFESYDDGYHHVPAGETVTVDRQLVQASVLRGRLVDAAGRPVPRGEVAIGSSDYSEPLGADGRWSQKVQPGEYTVGFETSAVRQWVRGARDARKAVKIKVGPSETVTVNERLLPTGSVAGRVTDNAGKALKDATMRLYADGRRRATVHTDKQGKYRFPYVFPGKYRLSVEPDNRTAHWARGKAGQAAADVIKVAAGKVSKVDHRVPAPGAVAGRFTRADGTGLPGAGVQLVALNERGGQHYGGREYKTKTDRTGRYRIAKVPFGQYKIIVRHSGRSQYVPGQADFKTAQRFTVRPGKTLTVRDKLVPAATMRVIVKDAQTGERLTDFCVGGLAFGNFDSTCTTENELVMRNLQAPRIFDVSVFPRSNASLHLGQQKAVKLKPGESRTVTMTLRKGGAIRTTATEAATGKPASSCVSAVRSGRDLLDAPTWCPSSEDAIRTGVLTPGTYNLFARSGGDLGAQWVGIDGGTGDQRTAAKITVRAGEVVDAPAIRFDRGGYVVGTVRSAVDGKPVARGTVSVGRDGAGDAWSRGTGRYAIGRLGPYAWPLQFSTDQGRFWSGGKGNRFAATPVQVKADGVVTHDESLPAGVVVRGSVTVARGAIKEGTLHAFSAVTGDLVAKATVGGDGAYAFTAPGNEKIRLRYTIHRSNDLPTLAGWYADGKDIDTADVVTGPGSGSLTLNLTVR